jgi:hypothetical protein
MAGFLFYAAGVVKVALWHGIVPRHPSRRAAKLGAFSLQPPQAKRVREIVKVRFFTKPIMKQKLKYTDIRVKFLPMIRCNYQNFC